MASKDLPIWIHPMRGPHFPDYATEDHSENEIWFTFGWPYETSACVTRLIFPGLFDKLPNLKIITHHMGGMIPFFAEKVGLGFTEIFQRPAEILWPSVPVSKGRCSIITTCFTPIRL